MLTQRSTKNTIKPKLPSQTSQLAVYTLFGIYEAEATPAHNYKHKLPKNTLKPTYANTIARHHLIYDRVPNNICYPLRHTETSGMENA